VRFTPFFSWSVPTRRNSRGFPLPADSEKYPGYLVGAPGGGCPGECVNWYAVDLGLRISLQACKCGSRLRLTSNRRLGLANAETAATELSFQPSLLLQPKAKCSTVSCSAAIWIGNHIGECSRDRERCLNKNAPVASLIVRSNRGSFLT